MSHQNIKSDLLVELSAEEGELLSGGQYRYKPTGYYCEYPYPYCKYDPQGGGGYGAPQGGGGYGTPPGGGGYGTPPGEGGYGRR